MANMNNTQKCTLACHVAVCLIKAQILIMSIPGFPLLRLHAARIWRDGARFRLDLLACLLDHITAKLSSQVHGRKNTKASFDSPIGPVPGGVHAITDTLRMLGLDQFAPEWDDLSDDDDTIEVFYSMYEQLTQQDVRGVDMLSLLGDYETYQPFTVSTANCRSAPFGPFHVQIHNQYVKWNKVTIVKPVQSADALPMPMLYQHVGPPKTKQPQKKSQSKRLTVSIEQLQDKEPRPGPSDTQRTPARDPNGMAPTLRPPEGTVARRSSSTQTSAVSRARASCSKAAPVSLPQVLPSVRNNQPAQHVTPVHNT